MSHSPKPYFDTIAVRSALLRLIEKLSAESGFPDNSVAAKANSMYSFYRNPAPVGKEYVVNDGWSETDEFKVLYDRLEEILIKKLPRAKSEKSKDKYSSEAISLSLKLWENLYVIEEGVVSTRSIEKNDT